jgi:hypothetical protein
MKTRLFVALAVPAALAAGGALAQIVPGPPPLPVGWHKCSACHTDDPTLCDELWCPPNTACGKQEGQDDGGNLWVRSICVALPV